LTYAVLFLSFLVAQRLGELVIAQRNTRRLLARGASEYGADHYPVMVTLHASWLAVLVVFGWNAEVHLGWLAVFGILQLGRVWVLATLGERWTTRIIVIDEPLVMRGPFRFIRHPNYATVAAEIAVAPLVLGLTWVAVLYTLLNAAMLYKRISVEQAALSQTADARNPATA
jgi:methyltransferase